jgi:hypothetical protein
MRSLPGPRLIGSRLVTDWAALSHAYGAAGDVPALLVAAEETGEDSGHEWNEVWGRLCHQGTVYSASFAALPLLADIAERHVPAGYIAALDLAGAIVASKDWPSDTAAVRQQHPETLRRLRDLAERNLAFADGDVEFIYGLQALMAFEDGGVWQRNLNYLADGDLPLECPSCHEILLLNLDGPEFTMTNDTDDSTSPTPVRPATPADGSIGDRMVSLCRTHGRSWIASRLPYAFGRTACPSCSILFEIPDALT